MFRQVCPHGHHTDSGSGRILPLFRRGLIAHALPSLSFVARQNRTCLLSLRLLIADLRASPIALCDRSNTQDDQRAPHRSWTSWDSTCLLRASYPLIAAPSPRTLCTAAVHATLWLSPASLLPLPILRTAAPPYLLFGRRRALILRLWDQRITLADTPPHASSLHTRFQVFMRPPAGPSCAARCMHHRRPHVRSRPSPQIFDHCATPTSRFRASFVPLTAAWRIPTLVARLLRQRHTTTCWTLIVAPQTSLRTLFALLLSRELAFLCFAGFPGALLLDVASAGTRLPPLVPACAP